MLLLWWLSMVQVISLSSWWKKFSSLLWSQTSNCFSLVAEFHLKSRDIFHKPTSSLFISLWVCQQPRCNLIERVLSKLSCGRSWHFLLHSVIPMIYLLLFLPEALWCCSFHSSSRIVRIVFFRAYPFNRSVVFSFEFSHLIKFCLLPQPECCLKSFLPLVPFFQ